MMGSYLFLKTAGREKFPREDRHLYVNNCIVKYNCCKTKIKKLSK